MKSLKNNLWFLLLMTVILSKKRGIHCLREKDPWI